MIARTNVMKCINESMEVDPGCHNHSNVHQLMAGAENIENIRCPSLRNLYWGQEPRRRMCLSVRNTFVTYRTAPIRFTRAIQVMDTRDILHVCVARPCSRRPCTMNNDELMPNPTKTVVRHRLSRGTAYPGLRTTVPQPNPATLVCFFVKIALSNCDKLAFTYQCPMYKCQRWITSESKMNCGDTGSPHEKYYTSIIEPVTNPRKLRAVTP
jgi:hypothetical protein